MEVVTDDTEVLIGHTRYATHNNAKLDEAAHPFKDGRVVGAHNGMIYNWAKIERELKRKDMIVDSQAIFALLNVCKDPAKALEYLEGYFALSWTKGKSLFLARSSDAVLSCAYVPKMRTLFWNSESANLIKVLAKHNVGGYELWQTQPDTIYRYDPSLFDEKGTNVGKNTIAFKSQKKVKTYRSQQRNFDWGRSYWDSTKGVEVMKPRAAGIDTSPGRSLVRSDSKRALGPVAKSSGQLLLSDMAAQMEKMESRMNKLLDRIAELENIIDFHGLKEEYDTFQTEWEDSEIEAAKADLEEWEKENAVIPTPAMKDNPDEPYAEPLSGICIECGERNMAKGMLLDAPNGQKIHEKCVFEKVAVH